MSHDRHTENLSLKEIDSIGKKDLMGLVRDWVDPFPRPPLQEITLPPLGGKKRVVTIVRDDILSVGTKARAGSAVFFQSKFRDAKTIVYVAPRAGWAPLSLAVLCKQKNRRLILFCPAAKEPSPYQLEAGRQGAELRFYRVAAMPVLQNAAKLFASKRGYQFFPLGLDVPAATAGISKVASGLGLKKITESWCVISTGVLNRGLQIAWPGIPHHAVAVARNIHAGERGDAILHSHPRDFLQPEISKYIPPYPTVLNYDAKVWRFVLEMAADGAVVWNVAKDPVFGPSIKTYNSNLPWGDSTDLERD